MSDHAPFRAAAATARAQAERRGLVISWMRYQDGRLEWLGVPKKAAKAAASEEPARMEPRKGRGALQGMLI